MHDPLDYMEIRRGLPNNGFGMVRNGGKRPHQGWDLWAPVGTPILAVGDGIIEFVRINSGDYGTQLCLSFENPDLPGTLLYAFYAHLSQVFVKTNDWATEGQRLGLSGKSGNASGFKSIEDEHLHFEVRTEVAPGKGLKGRLDPAKIFGYDLYSCSPDLPVCEAQ
jgi:murein DD-endopeptidase MepM/ murein hydrolase activator NlpD